MPADAVAMTLLVNGEPTPVPAGCRLTQLIEQLDLAGRRLAVEVNGELVPRSRFAVHALAPGDRIEIIQAVGGG